MRISSNKTDEELMALLAGGQLDAAAVLFSKYHIRLFNFFLKMGKSKPTSEDLVQVVFERVIKYRQSFKTGMMFRTWMYQIARNVQADDYHRQKPEVQTDFSALNGNHFAEESNVDQTEALVQLDKALQYLPAEHREVLLLTRFEQMKYAEVGILLGCTENAVKVKVFRALEKLRALYFKIEQL